MGTSGSEGGSGKPTSRKADRAPRPDPYTEHPTREGKVYCCVVLDTYSRRVVGWSIDSSPTAALATDALGLAIDTRLGSTNQAGTTIHSDQGVQGGFNGSSQHPLISEVFNGGDGGLEQEDQRYARGCASAVAC